MQSRQTILQILKQYKPLLQQKYPVKQIGLFGSYARGDAHAESDVDVVVELAAPMGLNFVAMANEIEDLLGIKTDVVPLQSLDNKFFQRVEKDIIYVW